jgi:hypothetical protein
MPQSILQLAYMIHISASPGLSTKNFSMRLNLRPDATSHSIHDLGNMVYHNQTKRHVTPQWYR